MVCVNFLLYYSKLISNKTIKHYQKFINCNTKYVDKLIIKEHQGHFTNEKKVSALCFSKNIFIHNDQFSIFKI